MVRVGEEPSAVETSREPFLSKPHKPFLAVLLWVASVGCFIAPGEIGSAAAVSKGSPFLRICLASRNLGSRVTFAS